MRILIPSGLLILTFLISGDVARAQVGTHLAAYAGIGEYDLSGVDEAPVLAVRGGTRFARLFLVEASLTYARVEQDFGRSRLFLPEVQAQIGWPYRRLEPYFGVGAGVAGDLADDDAVETTWDMTYSAAAGLRIALPANLGVGVDLRVRGIEASFTGSGTEATAGIAYHF